MINIPKYDDIEESEIVAYIGLKKYESLNEEFNILSAIFKVWYALINHYFLSGGIIYIINYLISIPISIFIKLFEKQIMSEKIIPIVLFVIIFEFLIWGFGNKIYLWGIRRQIHKFKIKYNIDVLKNNDPRVEAKNKKRRTINKIVILTLFIIGLLYFVFILFALAIFTGMVYTCSGMPD